MRPFEETEQRWSQLFNTSIGVDLRQAVRDDNNTSDPCESGLRSVCWKAFLLFGPLSKASWSKKLSESRSAYSSLRDHFLKYINNPNDLHSSVDPLADDDNSPWSSLRQDEITRQEIFQDVTRCMQDNYFFREPTTQKKLLDILFIYAKLNPDTGYRQGMHELLAPILWVMSQDAIDLNRFTTKINGSDGAEFMTEVLDKKYVEHDTFSLFCAVMQTAKGFYEMGESKDSAAIVAQSDRIHYELLAAVDPDLAHHLQVVGVLPQIYSIRWIRLLFGREFEFRDVLKMWDLLFAESLTLDIIDMTCVAMLLRIHWQLIDVDYTGAITSLTKFQLPATTVDPRSFVKDAIYLNHNKTPEGGADVIQKHTGQRPRVTMHAEERPHTPSSPTPRTQNRWSQSQPLSGRSAGKLSTPQRQLENLFQEVSGNLQRRTEGWSKTVRGAVGEVRKNMNNLQTAHSRGPSIDGPPEASPDVATSLTNRLRGLEDRNKVLGKMLDSALESLRASKSGGNNTGSGTDDAFNMALARIQFVSVYLTDSQIPIPPVHNDQQAQKPTLAKSIAALEGGGEKGTKGADTNANFQEQSPATDQVPLASDRNDSATEAQASDPSPAASKHTSVTETKPHVRPSLADSSFSFMLGENRHRSSFVSSVSDLPEQRRDSESRGRPNQLWEEPGDKVKTERKDGQTTDSGFTLSQLG